MRLFVVFQWPFVTSRTIIGEKRVVLESGTVDGDISECRVGMNGGMKMEMVERYCCSFDIIRVM